MEAMDVNMPSSFPLHVVSGYFAPNQNIHLTLENNTFSSWQAFQHDISLGHPSYKVIYFLRHAEGEHNEAERCHGTSEWNRKWAKEMQYFDAVLTENGVKQAEALKKQVNWLSLQEHWCLDQVVISPLTRAIQTALIVFESFLSSDKVSFEAHEECRETIGIHTCDKRHNVSFLTSTYPKIDFAALLPGDDDPLWQVDVRESKEEELARAKSFLLHLFRNDEKRGVKFVAVVSHDGFIRSCLKALGHSDVALRNAQFLPLVVATNEYLNGKE